MHEMQSIVTSDCSVCQSVCLSRASTRLHCTKTAERIQMLSGVNSPGGPWNIVLHGVQISPQRRGVEESFVNCGPL